MKVRKYFFVKHIFHHFDAINLASSKHQTLHNNIVFGIK